MTTQPEQAQTETTKQVDQYKMTVKTFTDETAPDVIKLHIQLSNEFNDLLKNIAVTGNEPVTAYISNGSTEPGDEQSQRFLRYPIKRWVMGSVGGDNTLMLFEKNLIDNGQTTFSFYSVRRLENTMMGLKQSMKSLIETYLRYNGIEQVITVNIGGPTQ